MKNDFTKTMRNVSLKDDVRAPRRGRDLAVTVDVDATDKLRFKGFMELELHYYNTLIQAFTSRARTFPETLLALHEDWMKLFAHLAYTGTSIRHLEKAKPDAVLTEDQEPFRKFLVGLDSHGKRFLSPAMYSIMEVAGTKATIHPIVRRNMATEILKYYKEQAVRVLNRGNNDELYKVAPEMLVVRDIAEKRHLQLPRQTLHSVTWDEAEDCTVISHCYSDKPLKILRQNLAEDNHWNLIIIHQETSVQITQKSPWIVDIRKVDSPYLVKYMDNLNPRTGQAFAIAKRRSFDN